MRELPRFPGKLRVAKALLGNLEGPGTEEALCPPSQVECHLRDDMRLANFQCVRGLDAEWKLLRWRALRLRALLDHKRVRP